MEKKFFIFIGRSGGGKGTQAELLKQYLEKKGHESVLHVTTGGGFRDFLTKDIYIAKLSKEINDKGGLQPEFLAVWNMANIFIDALKGGETIILDGAPRKPFEVHVLHSLITFLEYKNPVVIYLDVKESIAKDHLFSRSRSDDNEESITKRMNWFETEVLPTLEVYLHDPRYNVIHVNGDQSIEDVHNELIAKLENVT